MVANRFAIAGLVFVVLFLSTTAQARQEIRFYEANKLLQTDRVSLTGKKSREPGCHNFLIRTRVFQVNQIGYSSCSLYSERDCSAESLMEVNRTKEQEPVTEMSQGFSWFPIDEDERGAILRSWHCELDTQAPE